jgi:hypothetical protein
LERILTKLYHVDLGIEDNTRDIVKKNEELVTLREDRRVRDEEVEASRAQQAKARTAVMQKEKRIKKDEKALEGKVFPISPPMIQPRFMIFISETRTCHNGNPDCPCHPKDEKCLQVEGGAFEE